MRSDTRRILERAGVLPRLPGRTPEGAEEGADHLGPANRRSGRQALPIGLRRLLRPRAGRYCPKGGGAGPGTATARGAGTGRDRSDGPHSVAESFNSTLEWELLSGRHFATKTQTRSEVARFINIYSHRRRHSSCGMKPPVIYEQILAERATQQEQAV